MAVVSLPDKDRGAKELRKGETTWGSTVIRYPFVLVVFCNGRLFDRAIRDDTDFPSRP
jgi:hypothetical protein